MLSGRTQLFAGNWGAAASVIVGASSWYVSGQRGLLDGVASFLRLELTDVLPLLRPVATGKSAVDPERQSRPG